jgi:hypothetical protein
MINDKPEKIIFFKDVTFGVLYEQIKASQKLSNIINETMNQKIGVPLTALVMTCEEIQKKSSSKELDQIHNSTTNLSKDI